MVFSTAPVLLRICNDVDDANIVDVTVPVSPVVTTVPVTFGMVMVLSAVGSATVNVVSKALSVAPSNIIVPAVVMLIPEVVTAPVIGPVNAVAFTVPTTSNFVLGVVVPIPILDSAPSMVITVVLVPPSLTLNVMSVFCAVFDNITPLLSTVIERSLSAPTVNPESFTIPKVPVVVSLASDLRNDAAAMPPSLSASVAVPCNLIPEGEVVNVIPLYTVGKPVIAVCGVNSVSETMAISVPIFRVLQNA